MGLGIEEGYLWCKYLNGFCRSALDINLSDSIFNGEIGIIHPMKPAICNWYLLWSNVPI